MRSGLCFAASLAAVSVVLAAPMTPFLMDSSAVTQESLQSFMLSVRSAPHTATGRRPDMPHIRSGFRSSGGRLFAYPAAIEEFEDVRITWSSIPHHADDYVTVSCGTTNGLDDYLDRAVANESFVVFSGLINLRCDYTFTYVSVSGGQHVAVAQVVVPLLEGYAVPKQGHLMMNDNPDEMVVMWVSNNTIDVPVVVYSTSEDLSNAVTATGSSDTYTAASLCNAPANVTAQAWFFPPGYIHTATMTGLAPATQYFYKYGSATGGWSTTKYFLSRPLPSSSVPVKFIAYADQGVWAAPASVSTAQMVTNEIVLNGFNAFLLHFGDISYAMGSGWQWDRFHHLIEPYATLAPYMISIGNRQHSLPPRSLTLPQ